VAKTGYGILQSPPQEGFWNWGWGREVVSDKSREWGQGQRSRGLGGLVVDIVPRPVFGNHLLFDLGTDVGVAIEHMDFVEGNTLDRHPRRSVTAAVGFVGINSGKAGLGLADVNHSPSPAEEVNPTPQNPRQIVKALKPHFQISALFIFQHNLVEKSSGFYTWEFRKSKFLYFAKRQLWPAVEFGSFGPHPLSRKSYPAAMQHGTMVAG
jgi:hypothetical protein